MRKFQIEFWSSYGIEDHFNHDFVVSEEDLSFATKDITTEEIIAKIKEDKEISEEAWVAACETLDSWIVARLVTDEDEDD